MSSHWYRYIYRIIYIYILFIGILSSLPRRTIRGVVDLLNKKLLKYALEHFSLVMRLNVLRQLTIDFYTKEIRRIHEMSRNRALLLSVLKKTDSEGEVHPIRVKCWGLWLTDVIEDLA